MNRRVEFYARRLGNFFLPRCRARLTTGALLAEALRAIPAAGSRRFLRSGGVGAVRAGRLMAGEPEFNHELSAQAKSKCSVIGQIHLGFSDTGED